MTTDRSFGHVDGRPAHAFVVDGGAGVRLTVSDHGARLVELWAPDRHGEAADVVLGFDSAEGYAASPAFMGATVGRYGNRIAGGRLPLLGRVHQLDRNEGDNHLHGGRAGWDTRLWEAEQDGTTVRFRTHSADGEMGYPGACEVTTTYTLDGATLRITMEAVPTETTAINMVNHLYLNLAGHDAGTVVGHQLRLPSDFYTPVDDALIPTGEVLAVAGTRFDFRELTALGPDPAYDHNWCLRSDGSLLHEAAEVVDPGSGRRLLVSTTEPGVQVYTGEHLDDSVTGKSGARYGPHAGLTFETQKFPDSPHHGHFPTSLVHAGEAYRHVMVLELSTV